MKQVLELLKKDFLLIKKHIFMLLVLLVGITYILGTNFGNEMVPGGLVYVLLTFMFTLMLFRSVGDTELSQKGNMYMKTTPINNRTIVISKFLLVEITCVVVSVIILLMELLGIIPSLGVGFGEFFTGIVFNLLFFSIFIYIAYKYGYIALQVVSAGIMFGLPFGIGFFGRELIKRGFSINIDSVPTAVIYGGALILITIAMLLSIKATTVVLNNKEY